MHNEINNYLFETETIDLDDEFLDEELRNILKITESFKTDLISILKNSILSKRITRNYLEEFEEILINLFEKLANSEIDIQHLYLANDDFKKQKEIDECELVDRDKDILDESDEDDLGESDEDDLGESDEDTCLAAPYGEEK